MKRRSVLALMTPGIFLAAAGASAYKVVIPAEQIHESMSEWSIQCLAELRSERDDPQLCAPASVATPSTQTMEHDPEILRPSGFDPPVSVSELRAATRWPDDPQRQIKSAASANWIAGTLRYCEDYADAAVDTAGLLCASHFGSLQFIHSMASRPADPAQVTHGSILAWARFSYAYASGRIPDEEPLCEALKPYPEIRPALIGSDASPICKGGSYRPWLLGIVPLPWKNPTAPWTVGELFAWDCDKPLSSQGCEVIESVRERKLAAVGAVLHLIQDSFAQGHAERGLCAQGSGSDRTPTSKIALSAIRRFLSYRLQDRELHGKSDGWPQFVERDTAVDHPVLAGARILKMLEDGASPEAVSEYLSARVFALESPLAHEVSGPGECYAAKPEKKAERRSVFSLFWPWQTTGSRETLGASE
jgi:hypothetical protein